MSLCFYDLTDSSWSNCVLSCEGKLVPRATLEILQSVGAFTGTDGMISPLLAVVLGVLQDVTCGGAQVGI